MRIANNKSKHQYTGERSDTETVRRGTHKENRQLSWLEFKANDSKANNLPRLEREREQEHVRKAVSNRRRVCYCPAMPEQYG